MKAKYVRPTTPIEIRFWKHVDKSGDCWEWTGSRRRGYGQTHIYDDSGRVKNVYSHRVSYEMAHGPIPDGMLVCHKCDNPACVRPDHLFLGTHDDNAKDCKAKDRRPRGVGLHGKDHRHPRGESNPKSKLTAESVMEIRRLREGGSSLDTLAKIFGISKASVSRIALGRSWAHI